MRNRTSRSRRAPAAATTCLGLVRWRRGLVVMLLLALSGIASAQERMELHLVLAFDVSASINDVEFDLQREGTAQALRSGPVLAAIDRAPGGVAIAVVQWSSISRQALGLDWVSLHSMADARAYADTVNRMPRRLPGGGTMIHSGLEFAARLLETGPGQARRQVIDIASNGRTDDPKRLAIERDRLLVKGIVINGLAIEEDDKTLTRYFERFVIGGANAFVITTDGFEDFTQAMETKLLREINGSVFSMRIKERRPRHLPLK